MGLIEFLHTRFAAVAEPERAVRMAAYTRTDMPMYGVSAAQQTLIVNDAMARFAENDFERTLDAVGGMWSRPHREMKYAAIEWAAQPFALQPRALTLHRHMIVDGAWWDLTDRIAQRLIGGLLAEHTDAIWPTIEAWAEHSNLWLRRAALLCQLGRGDATNGEWLMQQCGRLVDDDNFFIQEAIGIALRDHGAVEPELVAAFLTSVTGRLSRLPYQRVARTLAQRGYLQP